MAYPPPPYADAVCGTHVCGEAICGAWWAYPLGAGLQLGAEVPTVTAVTVDVVPSAGLGLGAEVPPVAIGAIVSPSAAGLALGAEAPALPAPIAVPDAGLGLGAVAPTIDIQSIIDITLAPAPAGLGLGATLPRAGQTWLTTVPCEDFPPVAAVDRDLVLVGAADYTRVLSADVEREAVLVPAGAIDITPETSECR